MLRQHEPETSPESLRCGDRAADRIAIVGFRWWVVGCQAATLYITWPLWQARDAPVMLPLFDLPQISFGWLLAGTLPLVLLIPRWGVALHVATFLISVLFDQTRFQPYSISLCFLMAATLPNPSVRLLARAHLISLWFFAGIHKLINPHFSDTVAARMYGELLPSGPAWGALAISLAIIACELLLGVLALWPRTRKLAAVLALVFHLSIVLALSPWGLDWTPQVWPWNLALALAGVGVLLPWKTSLWADLKAARWLWRAATLVLLLMPAGYYLALVDQFTAHSVFSGPLNPKAYIRRGDDVWDLTYSAWYGHHVVLPPSHRLYEQFFEGIAQPGDVLMLRDNRWIARQLGFDERDIPYRPEESASAGQ